MRHLLNALHYALALALGLAVVTASAQPEERTPEEFCREFPAEQRGYCQAAAEVFINAILPPDVDLTIKITAEDGKLAYFYDPATIGNASADFRECTATDALVLPLGRSVRLYLISYDLTIYEWRIPSWDLSEDFVPGRMNEAMIEPIAATGEVEGWLVDENTGSRTMTKVRIVDDAYDANGKLKSGALCKS